MIFDHSHVPYFLLNVPHRLRKLGVRDGTEAETLVKREAVKRGASGLLFLCLEKPNWRKTGEDPDF